MLSIKRPILVGCLGRDGKIKFSRNPRASRARQTDQDQVIEILGFQVPKTGDTGWQNVDRSRFRHHLVLRFLQFIHRDVPVLAFPAKAGTHVRHGHRPSPVWQKL
jgi:hypothetical protein